MSRHKLTKFKKQCDDMESYILQVYALEEAKLPAPRTMDDSYQRTKKWPTERVRSAFLSVRQQLKHFEKVLDNLDK